MPTRTPLTLLLDGVLFENPERVELALRRIKQLVNLDQLEESPLDSTAALEEIVQALLVSHPQLAKVPTTRDCSLPLHYAVRLDSLFIVRRLLQRYREGVSMQNAKGKTPLHFAARNGRLDICRQILQIAPETASIACENGKLPLHFACREGHLDICWLLLQAHPEGASWQTDKCKVALHFAARWGHLQLAQVLVKFFPQGVSTLDCEGSLPLHDATRQGQFKMVQYLVSLYPKGLRQENVRGETPLFTAVRSGNLELSHFLMQAWPEGGKRVLQSAQFDDQVGSWEPELLSMCLYYGAAEKEGGNMPAGIAKRDLTIIPKGSTSKRPASTTICSFAKRRHLEYDSGNDDQHRELLTSQHGTTTFLPLHAALECGASSAVLTHILEKGTNQLMQRNSLGMLPLHVAAANFRQETLSVIISMLWKRYEQASSVRDNSGRLPLHLALQSRADCRLVECLLQSPKKDEDSLPAHFDSSSGGMVSADTPLQQQSTTILEEYPLLMATEYGCDLSTVYLLLREDPTVLKNACLS